MYPTLIETIAKASQLTISEDRKQLLSEFVSYLNQKKQKQEAIRLTFICTHNSRRSHLSQIWAQTMASFFKISNIQCYSGGTEATAMFWKIAETLTKQGFQIQQLNEESNPVYAIKFDANEPAVICFSKVYSDAFNPKNSFAAIMTCGSAVEGCPMVLGAEARFPIKYDDPKAFDNTEQMTEKYMERSLQIASEMYFVFSQLIQINQ